MYDPFHHSLYPFLSFFIFILTIRVFLFSEEIVTCSVTNEEDTSAVVNVGAPLLRYTNHERHVRENEDCAV